MTQKEKIEYLKETIVFLYEKEGRSKSYIAKLLEINRGTLTKIINEEWGLIQANSSYLKPSNQKFLNRNKNLIKSRLDNDISINDLAKELNVTREYLTRTIIAKDKTLTKAKEDYSNRKLAKKEERKEKEKSKSNYGYNIKDLEEEEWKELLGYENYYVSNKGRVKKYIKTYKDFMLLKPCTNNTSERLYLRIGKNNLQVSRLVGFNFVKGYSDKRNTINHLDGNESNNDFRNLEWVSQSDNNKHSYRELNKKPIVPYQRNGKFTKIILNDKYEFSTIRALSKFIGKSESQTHKYIKGEVKDNPFRFKFIY